MLLPVLVFVFVIVVVLGGYAAVTHGPAALERRRLERRLQELARTGDAVSSDSGIVRDEQSGPLPSVDKLLGASGSGLARLIEQADAKQTPSAVIVSSLLVGGALATVAYVFGRMSWLPFVVFPVGASLPVFRLMWRRSKRLGKFEEQFPEALELVSRAVRAGHAFQTGLGMVADELDAPVGPEFKKVFEQQNFGLPMREALNALAERVPLLDVRFFVTAVSIQRDTGGNLAEILDNLAHVVRERFKIQRQVKVHTAHGRITGLVLVALPAVLAILLTFINPDHMRSMFVEPLGRMLLMGTVVMQLIGFVWIRQVMKIEV
jgi:tight adherence protein B